MKYVSTFFGASVLAAMLATLPVPVHAQPVPVAPESEEDHNAHHPNGDQTATPSPTPALTAPSQPGGMMGMRSMMRGGEMMGMTPMMRGGEMMASVSATRSGRMTGGMPFEHVEGRLAFLKTELKITPAQEPQWTNFAAAVRAVAQSTKSMYEQMMQGGQMMQGSDTAVARLDRYEQILATRLETVSTVKGAFGPLYAALSGEQKKVADKLLASPMGIF